MKISIARAEDDRLKGVIAWKCESLLRLQLIAARHYRSTYPNIQPIRRLSASRRFTQRRAAITSETPRSACVSRRTGYIKREPANRRYSSAGIRIVCVRGCTCSEISCSGITSCEKERKKGNKIRYLILFHRVTEHRQSYRAISRFRFRFCSFTKR